MTSASTTLPQGSRQKRLLWARYLAGFYGATLITLMLVRYGLGDRWSWSFAINSLLVHAFWPAPVIVISGLISRDRLVLGTAGLSAILFAAHWGTLFVPTRASSTPGQTIRVMTYNALGYNLDTAGTVRVALEQNADIVALQELAPEHAEALEKTFGEKYRYRLMDARPGVTGCGILSRYPLRKIDLAPLDTLPWIGTPMAVEIDISGETLRFVNFHTYAGPAHTQMREKQARALAEFATAHPGALIMAGDLNATDQNAAYATITDVLQDTWRKVGFGFGHTFPGKPTPDIGGSRPVILGIPVPTWLVRIDYLFYSDALIAVDAGLGAGDAGSDHRAVIGTFVFKSL
jgi:endonuclease/exonuclease/phosphatase (EEP) superfamily protein YafD